MGRAKGFGDVGPQASNTSKLEGLGVPHAEYG